MTMHTEIYCTRLGDLDVGQAIRAIHEAYLQLAATAGAAKAEGFDNIPACQSLVACLQAAGHQGFDPTAGRV